jgi:hypothetical protein
VSGAGRDVGEINDYDVSGQADRVGFISKIFQALEEGVVHLYMNEEGRGRWVHLYMKALF